MKDHLSLSLPMASATKHVNSLIDLSLFLVMVEAS